MSRGKLPKTIKLNGHTYMTVANYAKAVGKTRQMVYLWLKDEDKKKEKGIVSIPYLGYTLIRIN